LPQPVEPQPVPTTGGISPVPGTGTGTTTQFIDQNMNGVDDSTEAAQMSNNFFGGMFGSVDPNSDVGRLLARFNERRFGPQASVSIMPRLPFQFSTASTGSTAGTGTASSVTLPELPSVQQQTPNIPVVQAPAPSYTPNPILTSGVLPGPLQQPSSIGTPFFQQNAGGLTPGTIPVAGPGPISLETGAMPLMQLATNPNLSPSILGGQETLGYYTDRFGNKILSPGAVGSFAEGGEVDAEAIRALMKRRRVDSNFSTAKEMLDSLSADGGEMVNIKVSPKKRTLSRASKRPISRETPSSSARGMVEEFDELSTARGPRSMETQKTGQQRIDFTTETLSSPELMRASIGRAGDLMTRRFKDGGEVAEQDPLIAAQKFLRKAAVRRMAEGGEVSDIPLSEQLGRKSRELKKDAADALGFSDIYMRSLEIPEKTYGEAEAIGGKTDAMRHLMLQALLTKKLGPTAASVIGNIHEMTSFSQPRAEKEMDMFNDRLGREIGKAARTEEDIIRMAKEYVDSGKVQIIPAEQREEYAQGGEVVRRDVLLDAQNFIRRMQGRK